MLVYQRVISELKEQKPQNDPAQRQDLGHIF